MYDLRYHGTLAILGAAIVGIFIGYFASGTMVVTNVRAPLATSTGLAMLPPVTLPAVVLPPVASTTPLATTTPSLKPNERKGAAPQVEQPAATAPIASAPAPAQTAPAPSSDLAAASNEIRAALVNIICTSPYGSGLQSISGSGIVIDPRGIILTNSHIGQYFLLIDRGVSCVIRTGSPAQSAYLAAPVFVSKAWLSANPSALIEKAPTGTGEHDLALLAITQSTTGAPLPTSFAYAPLAQDAPALNEPVVIGSYAAQFLQTSAIVSSLYPTIVYGSIRDVFTFETSTVDVVSLGGSAAAQEGSSGGGALDAGGNLVATITTSTTQGDTSARELDAITASYIRRDYAAETGFALSTLFVERPSAMIAAFIPQVPSLEAIITADLSN